MKKQKTVTVSVCDFCGSYTNVWHKCQGCQKDICYDCRPLHTFEYHKSVYFNGDDFYYCFECDVQAKKNKDPYWVSGQKIVALREESITWSADFKKRAEEAEATAKRLAREREGR
jgi:hypothetical protein